MIAIRQYIPADYYILVTSPYYTVIGINVDCDSTSLANPSLPNHEINETA